VGKKCSHVGISLFADAANVCSHRSQSFDKRERGREAFLMKRKRRLAVNFSVVRISPVVPRNIPRQMPATCPFPQSVAGSCCLW